MKRKRIRFIGYYLAIGLIVASTLAAASCSDLTLATPKSTMTSITTQMISSIAITPDFSDHFMPGSNHQFMATATFSNGLTQDITSQVTWTSSDTTIAAISSSGFATCVAAGTANITAALLGITSPALNITVWTPSPKLTSIAVTPVSPAKLAVGSTQQFFATALGSDGSTVDVTGAVAWTSSDPAVAVISPSGIAEGVGAGSTDITASIQGITSPPITLTVAVPVPALTSIIVTPVYLTERFVVGSFHQFTVTGVYSDGSTKDVTSQVTWTSSDTTVAAISSSGLATCIAVGNTNITAVLLGLTSPAVTLTVWAPKQ